MNVKADTELMIEQWKRQVVGLDGRPDNPAGFVELSQHEPFGFAGTSTNCGTTECPTPECQSITCGDSCT